MLDDEAQSLLRELANMAVGTGVAELARRSLTFICLGVPHLKIMPSAEVSDWLGRFDEQGRHMAMCRVFLDPVICEAWVTLDDGFCREVNRESPATDGSGQPADAMAHELLQRFLVVIRNLLETGHTIDDDHALETETVLSGLSSPLLKSWGQVVAVEMSFKISAIGCGGRFVMAFSGQGGVSLSEVGRKRLIG